MHLDSIVLPKGHPISPEPRDEVTVHFYKMPPEQVQEGSLVFQIWYESDSTRRIYPHLIETKWSTASYWRGKSGQWTLRWWFRNYGESVYWNGDKNFLAATEEAAYIQVCNLILKGRASRSKKLTGS